jgi:hypothetical protein
MVTVMSETLEQVGALDQAFDRMARSDFELPNGFVFHGPMACEALAALGREDQIEGWAERFARSIGERPASVDPQGGTDWDWGAALGSYGRLPEWLGYFRHAVTDDGWRATVELWVPVLMPGLTSALFHGAIRTAHAVRAIDRTVTPEREGELSRALGYWAARFDPGHDAPEVAAVDGDDRTLLAAGARGARHYSSDPNIFTLHGVTGAMAVELLASYLAPEEQAAALAQLEADQDALFGTSPAPRRSGGERWDVLFDEAAVAGTDVHRLKLVEACHRGFTASRDPAFVDAAREVTSSLS